MQKAKNQRRVPRKKNSVQRKQQPAQIPLVRLRPNINISYVDTKVSVSVATGVAYFNLLDSLLLNPSGLFPSNLQATRIALQSGTTVYYKTIEVISMDVHLNFVGSQSNTIVAGDLFNRVRLIVWTSEYPYSATTVPTWTIDTMTDYRVVKRTYADHLVNLPSQAFDTLSNFNVPQCITWDQSINMRKRFECFSSNNTGTQWDTRNSNLYLSFVSDSAVLPFPGVTGSVRLYYRELDQ
jgi:hypothetical protein